MVTDPYDDNDDQPTLQRPAPPSGKVRLAPYVPLDDAHTVDALPPDAGVALMDGPDYSDMETPKIPLDVAAALLRASQDEEGSGH